jgi:hypothetical protein
MSAAAAAASTNDTTATTENELNLERAIEKLVVSDRLIQNNEEGNDCTTNLAEVTTAADIEGKQDLVADDGEDVAGIEDTEIVDDVDSGDDDVIIPSSDLSDRNRRIWIVTTAGLPWMTGTAVNPLLRALSLCQDRPPHYVTLMIPWLVSYSERKVLYGNKHDFTTQQEQEAWIRQYCIDRCNCTHDVAFDRLKIKFWLGKYHESFGSIFPIEDICSTIPRDEADICILEEPEHLNWFRVPAVNSSSKKNITNAKMNNPSHSLQEEKKQESNLIMEAENPFEIEPGSAITPLPLAVLDGITTSTVDATVSTGTQATTDIVEVNSTVIRDEDIEVLGWAHKFQHVVGILHTNYADYIRQYGMASMVTAPALNALSSLVVKAYCHKVIRLSETLPPLDITKEVTCNVHGVRHEFLELPATTANESTQVHETAVMDEKKGESVDVGTNATTNDIADVDNIEIAPVYFIGKLIWAKGFERVLELEERYKMITNEYFPIDIYGGGKDEKEIQMAFFGRNGSHRGSSSSLHEMSASNQHLNDMTTVTDEKAAAVFGAGVSLRDQICGDPVSATLNAVDDDYVLVDNTNPVDNHSTNVNGSEEIAADISNEPPGTPPDATTSIKKLLATPNVDDLSSGPSNNDGSCVGGDAGAVDASASPIEVLGDLSGKTITTTVDTADATMKLIDSAMKAGLNFLSGNAKKKSETTTESSLSPKNNPNSNQPNPFQNIAPAKTRFKVSPKARKEYMHGLDLTVLYFYGCN